MNPERILTVINRQIKSDKIILTSLNPKDQYEMEDTEEKMTTHLTLNAHNSEYHQI